MTQGDNLEMIQQVGDDIQEGIRNVEFFMKLKFLKNNSYVKLTQQSLKCNYQTRIIFKVEKSILKNDMFRISSF